MNYLKKYFQPSLELLEGNAYICLIELLRAKIIDQHMIKKIFDLELASEARHDLIRQVEKHLNIFQCKLMGLWQDKVANNQESRKYCSIEEEESGESNPINHGGQILDNNENGQVFNQSNQCRTDASSISRQDLSSCKPNDSQISKSNSKWRIGFRPPNKSLLPWWVEEVDKEQTGKLYPAANVFVQDIIFA